MFTLEGDGEEQSGLLNHPGKVRGCGDVSGHPI